MKKNFKKLLSLTAVVGSVLLTSCIGDGPNTYNDRGYFTAALEGGSYVFYRDYGGAVRFKANSLESLNTFMKDYNGIKDGDRFIFIYTYEDNQFVDVAGKGVLIDNAEINDALYLKKNSILSQEQAVSQNVLAEDSVFSIIPSNSSVSDIQFGAYRGYLTAQFTGPYSIVENEDKKTEYVAPTLYLIMDPEQNQQPNTLNLQMSYNRHSSKDINKVKTSNGSFYPTFPLSALNGLISGNDSITINIEGKDLKTPKKLRIGREDLRPSNYIYFNK